MLAASRDTVEAAAHELEARLALPSDTDDWHRNVTEALRGTRRALDEHVSLNHAPGGALDALVAVQPDLRGPVQRLREEHTELETQQQHAENVANEASRDPEEVRDAARPLVLAARAHVQHTDDVLGDASQNT